jgi:glycosyltransferase involved in cell wall biosynthesis
MSVAYLPKVSIAVATYEMHGFGRKYLSKLFQSIVEQSFQNIEVVVSDNSADDEIIDECKLWDDRLDILVIRETSVRLSTSANFNIALARCSGDFIKILCQDDMLSSKDAIEMTVEILSRENNWLVSAVEIINGDGITIGQHSPVVSKRPQFKNLIGSQSCLAFRNCHPIEKFNENLLWRMDCELYFRLINRFGSPYILTTPTVCVRQWDGQATNTKTPKSLRIREYVLVLQITVSVKCGYLFRALTEGIREHIFRSSRRLN